MQIMSHRGYWKEPYEKNQEVAFRRSFSLGYGTETDVRDVSGSLVISHDMPSGEEMTLTQFLHIASTELKDLERQGIRVPLAVNIKADGLAKPLAEAMQDSPFDWFVFDMSIPDMRQQLNAGNPVYARVSEVELNPAWIDEIKGIWLDAFHGGWYGPEMIRTFLRRGLKVAIVSPELHKRDHNAVWESLKPFRDEPNVMLCSDIPEDATRFFGL